MSFVRSGALAATQGPPPITRVLSSVRAGARDRAIARHRPAADALREGLAAGDAEARAALADVAEAALRDMRADVARSARLGLMTRAAHAADRRWGDCDTPELLDDDALDPLVRSELMACLDRFNTGFGNYERFLDALLPLCRSDGPTRILDLAAGHGGFALEAGRIAERRGLELHFTATDLKDEYLEMGRAVASAEGLAVDFAVQDALDLRDIEGLYDVIVCTQSLHHFPAGLVAVLFETATRAAGTGVVLIDGCRGAIAGTFGLAIALLGERNRGFAHDAWVSTRRFFVPEELELLTRLGSWGARTESAWIPPLYSMHRLAV